MIINSRVLPFFYIFFLIFAVSCSFDYGEEDSSGGDLPNLVMENVEYVRVRSADPLARFQAERAERYEGRRRMELRSFTFEQYGDSGNEVNAFGRAGSASVNIDSGDVSMGGGVRIEVESEDIAIETNTLEWKDEVRVLSAGSSDEVSIYQSNGTSFTGVGFRADVRSRSWEFAGNVGGTYIQDDDAEENTNAAGDANDANESMVSVGENETSQDGAAQDTGENNE